MNVLTEEEIQALYDKFMEYVSADSRADKLRLMYEDLEDELVSAPASGKVHFHNAFPGGYLEHVVRVVETSLKVAGLYKQMGGDITFNREELIFTALHHDLGKLGDPTEGPYYITQESDWHRKRGEMFVQNDHLQYMKVPDRALFLLQKYDVKVTQHEFLGIKLSDGMYNDASKAYLTNHAPYAMKTTLPYIIHWADHMASRVEGDKGKF